MAAPPPVLTVAVERGPRQGETRQCRAGAALRVGRVVKGNDLAVRDGGASQRHLVIEFLPPPGAGWAVSDLGTSNGTLLNGAPLVPSVPSPLSDGYLIKVGDSTVLAVSMASDSDPKPVANPSQRRTSRHAAAAVEEKPPAVTRRGTRNKTAAEAPEVEKEEPDAAAVVVEEKKPPAVTRRGTRSKAPPVAEPPEVEKEEPDAAAVVVEEKPQVARRRGERKKLTPEQMDETAEAPSKGEQKKDPEPSEPENDDVEKEEAMVLTRRGSRKSVTEPPKPNEEEKEEKEENAPVVTRRGGRKKNAVTIAPPPLPPKTKSVRGRGRGTRATASSTVLQDEQGGNELAASRAQTANPLSPTALKGGEEQKVATGDGGVELEDTAKALKEEMPKGRANAHRAASDNGAKAAAAEPTGEMAEAAEVNCRRRQRKVVEHHEPKKDGEETTRRGGRKEVAEQSEPGKDEDTIAVTCRGGRKKVVEQPATKKDAEESAVVTRGGGRKKVVDQLESEKDVKKTTVVTRRGGQKKVVEQPEPNKHDNEKEEGAPALIRRGGRKKSALTVAPPSLPPKTSSTRGRGRATRTGTRNAILEEDEEEQGGNELDVSIERIVNPRTSMAMKGGEEQKGDKAPAVHGDVEGTVKALEEELPKGRARAKLAASKDVAYAAALKLIVETEETSEAPRRGRRKKAVEPLEPEKEEEDAVGVTRRKGQKKAAVVTRRAWRKKDSAMVSPLPLPPKTGSGRGRRRVTRTNARNNILEDEAEQEEDEVAVPREQAVNLQIAMAGNGGEDRDVEGTVGALEDDAPEGRDSALHASSDNGVKEVQGGTRCSSRVDSGSNGIPNTTSKYREDRKLKAYSTPFDVRLDRALKKYSS